MVTSRVVAELGLLPVGMAPFRGIHGIVSRPIYLFHVAFYGDEVQQAELAKRTIDTQKPVRKIYICPTAIEGGELEDQPNFDVLLGMDIIRTETLTISKEGSFSFGF